MLQGADATKEYIARFYPNGIPKEAEQAIMVASTMQCDEVSLLEL